jgi:hypothetical protein
MVDNDEYINNNLMINYDSKRFNAENSSSNSNRNNPDIQFHSRSQLNPRRRKIFFSFLYLFEIYYLKV